MKPDSYYMELAIQLALQAAHENEVPVGAIIVDATGEVVASAFNSVETDSDSTSHAEIKAISKLSRQLGTWRLNEYTLYSTLEPCQMCMGAIYNSRISKLSFATNRTKEVTKTLTIQSNILKPEAEEILKTFFTNKR